MQFNTGMLNAQSQLYNNFIAIALHEKLKK